MHALMKLRRRCDLLDDLRERIHLAEHVEQGLEVALEGLKEWGYFSPRVYRHSGEGTYSLVKTIDLPLEMVEKKTSFDISTHKILEEIIENDNVYVRDEVPRELLAGEGDPCSYVLQHQPQAVGLVGIPYYASSSFFKKRIRGLIAANYDPQQKEVDDAEEDILKQLGRIVSTKVVRMLEHKQYEKRNRQLAEQIKLDGPTGLYNKKTFHEHLEEYVGQEQDYHLLLLDCDGLKGLNDTYGHPAGDKFLEDLGESLRRANNHTIAKYRIGGDEFSLVLETDDMDHARAVAEQMRRRIKEIPVPKGYRPITFSVGIACSEGFKDGEGWYKAADVALYKAKGCRNKTLRYLTGGGDRTFVFDEVRKTPLDGMRDYLRDNVCLYRTASAVHKRCARLLDNF